MFYRKFAEEGNNLVDNLNKYNVCEDNLSVSSIPCTDDFFRIKGILVCLITLHFFSKGTLYSA
jgi:hypothetical protein